MGKVISCESKPPWYEQLIKMSEKKRRYAVDLAMAKIKEAKPDTYEFIQNFNCELVGFIPNVQYTRPDDDEKSLDITYIHDFSQYTLLFWCEKGGFSFFVNASLKYNDGGLLGFTY